MERMERGLNGSEVLSEIDFWKGEEFPVVRQVELVSHCQLRCSFCPKYQIGWGEKVGFIDIGLVERMVREGWLRRTLYLELQLRGEPLLHPKFGDIVDILSEEVYLGLSTNGMLLEEKAKDVGKVDFVTVSVDSVGEEYERLRKCGEWDKLLRGLEVLVDNLQNTVLVELQVIDGIGQESVERVVDWWQSWIERNGVSEKVKVRVVDECYRSLERREVGICVNPYVSVALWCDGTVVSCCYMFGVSEKTKYNVYGKVELKGKGLSDVWRDSKERRFQLWKSSEFCKECKYPNEVVWYYTLVTRLLKSKGIRRLKK